MKKKNRKVECLPEEDQVVDLTGYFKDPFSLPCCPICDNAIEEWMNKGTFRAHGGIYLGHIECIVAARQELGV